MGKVAIVQSGFWSERFRNFIKLFLKVVVTSLLLYYVYTKIDVEELKGLIKKVNLPWMALGLASFFISTIFSASRLLDFLRPVNIDLGFRYNLQLYMLGMFYNLCLPGGIGGDGYKVYLLSNKYNFSAKKTFLAILFDRVSGFWAVGFLTVMVIPFVHLIQINFLIPLSIFIFGSFIYYLVARNFFKAYTRYFFQAHIKAVLVQSFQVLTIILLLRSVHFTGIILPYLLTFLISALSAIFPFTIGGLGARELIFNHMATFMVMDLNVAVFISLSFYLITAAISLLGVYYVFNINTLPENAIGQE